MLPQKMYFSQNFDPNCPHFDCILWHQEIFLSNETPKANPFALFWEKFFLFELGTLFKCWSGIKDNAQNPDKGYCLSGLFTGYKNIKIVSISRVRLSQSQRQFEKCISYKILTRIVHIFLHFATKNFSSWKKTQRLIIVQSIPIWSHWITQCSF